MPKLEPKVVQKEIEQGQLWPVYWLYGTERMKSRELWRRIRRVALGGEETKGGLPGLNEETFDATESSASTILDAARAPLWAAVCVSSWCEKRMRSRMPKFWRHFSARERRSARKL